MNRSSIITLTALALSACNASPGDDADHPAAQESASTTLTVYNYGTLADAKLHPLLEQSFGLQEDVPLSQNLSALGATGLKALDYLDKGQTAPDSWKTQQMAVIDQAKTRQADMLLMVVAPVQQLVEASAGQHN